MVTSKAPAAPSLDPDLAAAHAARDKRRMLELLMERYGDSIYRYAVAMTRDRDAADEIRQVVFVQAFRDMDNVEEASMLPTWLYGIARYRCLDALRARGRWQQRFTRESAEDAELSDVGLDDKLDHCRLARCLARCLAHLAPAAREAVVLRYQQGLSYVEAARVLGELPGTIQRRVSRTLPLLRQCVEASLQPEDSNAL